MTTTDYIHEIQSLRAKWVPKNPPPNPPNPCYPRGTYSVKLGGWTADWLRSEAYAESRKILANRLGL